MRRLQQNIVKRKAFRDCLWNHLLHGNKLKLPSPLSATDLAGRALTVARYSEIVPQIGPYRILSEAGAGPLSTFYHAADSSGNTVSVRSIHVGQIKDAAVRRNLSSELRVAATMLPSLRHPNAECVLEIVDAGADTHIISEPIDAPTFSEAARQDIPERLAGLSQLAAALEQSRRLGIVHGAVWPQHIFGKAGASPRLVLTEFVVARLLIRFIDPADPFAAGLRYLSPEQVQETSLTPQSDQFSLAAVAYEWLTGANAFDARQLPTVFYRICKETPRRPSELNPHLGRAADDVLLRALSKRAEQRYPGAAAFVEALREALEIPLLPPARAVRASLPPAPPDRPQKQLQRARPLTESVLPPVRAAVWNPPPALVESKSIDQPPVPPPALLPKSGAPTANGRIVSVALIALLVIGAAIWVDRYRHPEPPIPVQQADPEHSPLSPPPEDTKEPQATAKPEPKPSPTASSAAPAEHKPAEPAEPAAKSVRLLSIPPGAQIEVDHDTSLACIAPCTLDLPAGRHTLEAKSWGTAVERRIFNVPNDAEVTVTLASSVGTLLVSSSPPGALVLVDGADRGNTPATIRLAAGSHRISVINGNHRSDDTVQIENDTLTTRNYQW
jgi:serine/threonine-protein kinase